MNGSQARDALKLRASESSHLLFISGFGRAAAEAWKRKVSRWKSVGRCQGSQRQSADESARAHFTADGIYITHHHCQQDVKLSEINRLWMKCISVELVAKFHKLLHSLRMLGVQKQKGEKIKNKIT